LSNGSAADGEQGTNRRNKELHRLPLVAPMYRALKYRIACSRLTA
jgi:hypothetical protein